MSVKATQAQRVLEYIRETGSITQLEALQQLGVMRLASRITDLKRQGYAIRRDTVPIKTRYGNILRNKFKKTTIYCVFVVDKDIGGVLY